MKSWNSMREFFSSVNDKVDYVVLRNYELIGQEKLIKNYGDFDVLCTDRNEFIKRSGAEIIIDDDNRVHTNVNIGVNKITLDLRTVGDGYYDVKWQRHMLKNKRMFKGICYVLDDEDYFYSLVFHSIFQKRYISYDYQKDLVIMAKKRGISVECAGELKEYLIEFLEKNGYEITQSKENYYNYVNIENLPNRNRVKLFFKLFFWRIKRIKNIYY